MTARRLLATILALSVSALGGGAAAGADKDGFADAFNVAPESFSPTGRNDFAILEPDYQLVYRSGEGDAAVRRVVTVLPLTEVVDGVEARVVETVDTTGDLPRRVTRHYLAVDRTTNDVYCFGRDVDRYDGWRANGHGGSWRAGQNGARYGLLMPGSPAVGQKFCQALAARGATDRTEIASVTEAVQVRAARYQDCLKTFENTPQNPKRRVEKFYARGVGLVIDGTFKLANHGRSVTPRPDVARMIARAKERAKAAGEATEPVIELDFARAALDGVGADPDAEAVWLRAINDPALSKDQRKDLIEDLNTNGFDDARNVRPDELPLVMNRLALIEELAPHAMDDTNYDAFAEAYKDLVNIANRLTR